MPWAYLNKYGEFFHCARGRVVSTGESVTELQAEVAITLVKMVAGINCRQHTTSTGSLTRLATSNPGLTPMGLGLGATKCRSAVASTPMEAIKD